MASTVRISDESKKKLKSLIKYLGFKTNRNISQKDLIDALIELNWEDREGLVRFYQKNEEESNWKEDPIFEDVDIKMNRNASESVDEILYGKK